jgi:hypothetical protein
MKNVIGFALGFVAGWAARSMVESSRGAAVGIATTAADVLARLKRAAAIEAEYLDDFIAEVRSRVQENRGWRENAADASASTSGPVPTANGGIR